MLYLRDDFARCWKDRDPFQAAASIEGRIYRRVKSRRTLQFSCRDRSFFLKLHQGAGWAEILKNLLKLRLPILGARNEWEAIEHLKGLGIETMTPAAYGSRGLNPARRQSFIITEDLVGSVSLEDYCRGWADIPPPFYVKQRLLSSIAEISRRMHEGGLCHRDFYLCHFHLDNGPALEEGRDTAPRLFLIDLHRALISTRLRNRWVVKDVAGLYYSALHIGLTRRDCFRFIRLYSGRPLREALTEERRFWLAVDSRAQRMLRKYGGDGS